MKLQSSHRMHDLQPSMLLLWLCCTQERCGHRRVALNVLAWDASGLGEPGAWPGCRWATLCSCLSRLGFRSRICRPHRPFRRHLGGHECASVQTAVGLQDCNLRACGVG